jgi:hypothetical protein
MNYSSYQTLGFVFSAALLAVMDRVSDLTHCG